MLSKRNNSWRPSQLVSLSISSLKYEKISVMGNCTQKCFVAAEGVLDMAIGEHMSDWKVSYND